jgi:hypothetical protein
MKASLFALATMAFGVFAAPAPAVEHAIEVRDVASSGEVLTIVTDLVQKVQGSTDSMNGIVDQVNAGDLSKEDAATSILDELSSIQLNLKNIIVDLTGAAGIPVSGGDVDLVLGQVKILLNLVLTTVNTVVKVLGLSPQLTSLLHSVFSLLAKIVLLLNGILVGLLPGLVAALSPLLAGLGNGLLAPLLTPLVALIAGIAL